MENILLFYPIAFFLIIGIFGLLFWNIIEQSTLQKINWHLIVFIAAIEFFCVVISIELFAMVYLVSNFSFENKIAVTSVSLAILTLINFAGGYLLTLTDKVNYLQRIFSWDLIKIKDDKRPIFVYLIPFYGKPIIRNMDTPTRPWLHGLLSSLISMSILFVPLRFILAFFSNFSNLEEEIVSVKVRLLLVIYFSLLGGLGAFLGSQMYKK